MRCAFCNAFIPAAKSVGGKWLGGAVASSLGLAKTKSVGGALLFGVIGIAAGHLADVIIDWAARPVCGSCQGLEPA